MGYQGMMMGGAVQGSLGDVGLAAPPADTTTTKSNAWPWVLGLAAVGGVVYLATRDGSMSNPAYPLTPMQRQIVEASGCDDKDAAWLEREAIAIARTSGSRTSSISSLSKKEFREVAQMACAELKRERKTVTWIVDIGDDATDQPSKAKAIALAKKFVKKGGVYRGGQDTTSDKAFVVKSGWDVNEPVYGIWRDDDWNLVESTDVRKLQAVMGRPVSGSRK